MKDLIFFNYKDIKIWLNLAAKLDLENQHIWNYPIQISLSEIINSID